MRLEVAVKEWRHRMVLKLRTRGFDVGKEKNVNLTELAIVMEISVSQLYRVRQGKRSINGRFITGAIESLPGIQARRTFLCC